MPNLRRHRRLPLAITDLTIRHGTRSSQRGSWHAVLQRAHAGAVRMSSLLRGPYTSIWRIILVRPESVPIGIFVDIVPERASQGCDYHVDRWMGGTSGMDRPHSHDCRRRRVGRPVVDVEFPLSTSEYCALEQSRPSPDGRGCQALPDRAGKDTHDGPERRSHDCVHALTKRVVSST
jgi:hypothetical protein